MKTRALLVMTSLLTGLSAAACSGSGASDGTGAAITTGGSATGTATPATLSPSDLIQGANVRFSEIHYHPAADVEADEFIELVNAGDQPVQMQGWCVTGIKFCFTDAIDLAPGAFLVLRRGEYELSLIHI